MRATLLVALLPPLFALAVAPTAAAQSKPDTAKKPPAAKPAEPPAAPAAPSAPVAPVARVKPTFDSLHVAADELPKEWKFGTELECVSPQPATLFESDLYSQLLPKAAHQDFQTIVATDATGSILYFDWGDAIPDAVEEFIPPLLFGEQERSTMEHPEQIVRSGGVMAIVSFPLKTEARKWVIERLRVRFGLRLAHDFVGDLKPAIQTLFKASGKGGDPVAGLAYATEHEKELSKSSFAAFLEGELATLTKDYVRSEKAYGRALALDASTDPLPNDGVAWASMDGHGGALYGLKKYEDGARELAAAAKVAGSQKRPKDQSKCLYNCACCLALSGKGDEAIAALKQAIALDPAQKASASKDEDFASIKARPEFQALLK